MCLECLTDYTVQHHKTGPRWPLFPSSVFGWCNYTFIWSQSAVYLEVMGVPRNLNAAAENAQIIDFNGCTARGIRIPWQSSFFQASASKSSLASGFSSLVKESSMGKTASFLLIPGRTAQNTVCSLVFPSVILNRERQLFFKGMLSRFSRVRLFVTP